MKVTAGEHKLSEAGGILVLLLPENNEILGKLPFFVEHKGKKKELFTTYMSTSVSSLIALLVHLTRRPINTMP